MTSGQVEVCLKQHRLLHLQVAEGEVRLIIQPEAQGFQAIDFVQPEPGPLDFIFVRTYALQQVTVTFGLKLTFIWLNQVDLLGLSDCHLALYSHLYKSCL